MGFGTRHVVVANPGADADIDLITVQVTGTPKVLWDESDDRLSANKSLDIDGTTGYHVTPGSDADTDVMTVNVTGTPKEFWDESQDQWSRNKGLHFTAGAVTTAEVSNGNSGDSKTIDWTAGIKQRVTLTDNCAFTFTAPAGPCNLTLVMLQDATGSRNPSWPSSVHWAGQTEPTWSTVASRKDIVTFYYDGTNYNGAADINFG